LILSAVLALIGSAPFSCSFDAPQVNFVRGARQYGKFVTQHEGRFTPPSGGRRSSSRCYLSAPGEKAELLGLTAIGGRKADIGKTLIPTKVSPLFSANRASSKTISTLGEGEAG
jgi:hypothetical protein